MTTYILHGGMASRDCHENDLFFEKFTSLIDEQNVNILLCYWARSKDEWTELERDTQRIKCLTTKDVTTSVAENPQDLFEKLKDCHVLYVAGGEAENIEPYYSEMQGLTSALEGKIYLGSSMGAFMASKKYVLSFDAQDATSAHHGLGLVNINTLCHWDIEDNKKDKIDLLKKEDPQGDILLLDELRFVSIC